MRYVDHAMHHQRVPPIGQGLFPFRHEVVTLVDGGDARDGAGLVIEDRVCAVLYNEDLSSCGCDLDTKTFQITIPMDPVLL